MLEHKEKIKKCFLAQIDKYVDYYIQKTIKWPSKIKLIIYTLII